MLYIFQNSLHTLSILHYIIIHFLPFYDNTRTSYNNSSTSYLENKIIFPKICVSFFTRKLSYIVKGKIKR